MSPLGNNTMTAFVENKNKKKMSTYSAESSSRVTTKTSQEEVKQAKLKKKKSLKNHIIGDV